MVRSLKFRCFVYVCRHQLWKIVLKIKIKKILSFISYLYKNICFHGIIKKKNVVFWSNLVVKIFSTGWIIFLDEGLLIFLGGKLFSIFFSFFLEVSYGFYSSRWLKNRILIFIPNFVIFISFYLHFVISVVSKKIRKGTIHLLMTITGKRNPTSRHLWNIFKTT